MSRSTNKASRWVAITLIMIALALGFQISRLILALATPQSPAGMPSSGPAQSAPAGLSGEFDPFFRSPAASDTNVVTALPIKLFGTRLDSATGRGFAIIAAPDGQQSSFAVGETIMPGVKLWAVARDEVTIDRNGARERLFLDQSIPPAPAGSGVPGASVVPSLSVQPASDPSVQRVVPPAVVSNSTASDGGDIVAPSLDKPVPAMPEPVRDRGIEP